MEKTLIHAYIVEEYSDGNFDVRDAEVEGTETLTKEDIYQSITLVADLIEKTREANLVKVNVYRAMAQFFEDRAAMMQNDEIPEQPQVTLD
jgi:hypothetical protein